MMRASFILILLLLVIPRTTHAILPPEMIYAVGSQVLQLFSVVAVVIGLFISSLYYWGNYGLIFLKKRIRILFVCLTIILMGVFIWLYNYQLQVCLTEVELVRQDVNHVPEGMISKLCGSSDKELQPEFRFYSDTITLYGQFNAEPFFLILTVDRQQDDVRKFTQSVSAEGYIDGQTISLQDITKTNSINVTPASFLRQFNKEQSADLLNRYTYTGKLDIAGVLLYFSIQETDGDFITHLDPANVQHFNAATALVTFGADRLDVQAVTKTVFADDYRKYVLFKDGQETKVTAHKFLLWDENNNFYLLDHTVVELYVLQKPSYSLALHKNVQADYTKKSHQMELIPLRDAKGSEYWQLHIPAFGDAKIQTHSIRTVSEKPNLATVLVEGEIVSETNRQSIKGILQITSNI